MAEKTGRQIYQDCLNNINAHNFKDKMRKFKENIDHNLLAEIQKIKETVLKKGECSNQSYEYIQIINDENTTQIAQNEEDHGDSSSEYTPVKKKNKHIKVSPSKSKCSKSSRKVSKERVSHKKCKEQTIQKQKEEQKELNFKFKAKPNPIPKCNQHYQTFLKELEEKKQMDYEARKKVRSVDVKRIDYLKQNTKLFEQHQNHQERDQLMRTNLFRAKPTPQYVRRPLLSFIQEEKVKRRQKTMSQTKDHYQKWWKMFSPPVKKIEDKNRMQRESDYFPNYKQKIPYKNKEIPNFYQLHQKNQRQLEQIKRKQHTTSFQEFNFTYKQRHHKCQQSDRSQRSERKKSNKSRHYKDILSKQKPNIYYTQKFEDMIIFNKEKALKKQKQINDKLHKQLQRKEKHQNFAKYMKSSLKKIPDRTKILKKQAQQKIKQHKMSMRNLQTKHQQNLTQMYEKVLTKPFLFEIQTIESQQIKKSQKKPKEKGKKGRKTALLKQQSLL